jgi:hypothetical protein
VILDAIEADRIVLVEVDIDADDDDDDDDDKEEGVSRKPRR